MAGYSIVTPCLYIPGGGFLCTRQHLGMCSIPSYNAENHRSNGLWRALLPSFRCLLSGTQAHVVSKVGHLGTMRLSVLDRLRVCKKWRFELGHLRFGAPARFAMPPGDRRISSPPRTAHLCIWSTSKIAGIYGFVGYNLNETDLVPHEAQIKAIESS